MKYVYIFIATVALVSLPASVSAAPDPHTNITPLDEYVAQEIKSFNSFVSQQPAPSEGRLAEAVGDITGVLESYIRLSGSSS